MGKVLSKFLIIILSIDLLFTSFYPFFVSPGVIYAQSEEDYWAADAALSAETAETQPADVPAEQSEQVDFCQTYGEGCGEPVLTEEPVLMESPTPELTPEPVVDQSYQWADYALTDSYTQEQALDTYETRVYDAMSTQEEAEVEQRQEDNSWDLAYYATQAGDSISENIASTVDNTAEVVDDARLQAGNAWNDFYASQASDQKELQKQADEAQAEADARDNEFAQSLAQAETELEKKAPGYSWDAYQAENADAKQALETVKALGGQLEGTPADFTFTLPSYAPTYANLSYTKPLEITSYPSEQLDISPEMLLDLASMGLWPLAEKANDQIKRTSEMKPVYDQTGMFERTMDRFNNMDQYYQPGEINGTLGGGQSSRYPDYLREKNTYKDIVSAREILDDIKFYPDLGSDEKNQTRLDLLQMAIDREQKGVELGTDIAAWTAMTVVGGKAVEVGIKGVGAAAKPFINKLAKKGEAEVADAAKAVANALDDGEPIFAGVDGATVACSECRIIGSIRSIFGRKNPVKEEATEQAVGKSGQVIETHTKLINKSTDPERFGQVYSAGGLEEFQSLEGLYQVAPDNVAKPIELIKERGKVVGYKAEKVQGRTADAYIKEHGDLSDEIKDHDLSHLISS